MKWRGEWYIFHHRRREFLIQACRVGENRDPDNPDRLYARWTPSIRFARAYKNPSMAQKMARKLNAEIAGRRSSCYPCQPVTVVTGEAARCLDLINRRDTNAAQIHGV